MSLGAVFLALGIGVLLGVAIGENGVVSGASKDLENSLRGDLNNARSRNTELRREIAIRDDYENQTYEPLVRDLLPGWRVGIVAMGSLPGGYSPRTSRTRSSPPARARLGQRDQGAPPGRAARVGDEGDQALAARSVR